MRPGTIGIIGGLGRMGKLLRQILMEAGYPLLVADIREAPISREIILQSDVLILAVPISELEGVLREIGPYTREDGVVIDIASVKEGPVRWMLQYARGEVIGAHPLFGPSIDSLENQVIFVHPARSKRWIGWFMSFFQAKGARMVEILPDRHDRLMAHVQVLRHLLLICFGRSLMELGFDLGKNLSISGPWFQNLVGMLAHQAKQDSGLYADLALHNPAAPEVFEAFLHNVKQIHSHLISQDRAAMVEMMAGTAEYIQSMHHSG